MSLIVERLSIAYGTAPVLREVSFSVAAGEMYGLVGESGCGKTTLGYALGGHLGPTGRVSGGRVLVDDTDVFSLTRPRLRRWRATSLAVVHQDAAGALDPTMRIGRQLAELVPRDRVTELLHKVRLPDPAAIARRYPHQLSGGQQQRVVIAAALALRPRLLVLDEPTTGLDASVEHDVLRLLADLRGELAAAVVYISHDLGLIGQICDRVGVLYGGRLVEEGQASEVLAAPAHPYTSALLAAVPALGVPRRERPLRAIPGRLPLAGEELPGCAFAPRCPLAEDACRTAEPPLDRPGSSDRSVRCLHPGAGASVNAPRASVDAPRTPSRGAITLLSPTTARTAQRCEPDPVDDPAGPDHTTRRTTCQTGPAAGEPLLMVRGLTRRYGSTVAVDNVDLTVRQGEILGLVGESGSGKTTLARAIAGLGTGGPGSITLSGEAIAVRPRRDVQMVFQNPDASLNPAHTVRTVLRRALRRLGGAESVDDLAARTHIGQELLSVRPVRLSGGQKQRVAIARGLAGRPALVVCDEPVSALDVSVQAAVLELLAEQRADTSYLFISHDLAVVSYLADRVAVMYRGAIVEEGATSDVLHGPSHPYTAMLVAAAARSGAPAEVTGPAVRGGCRFAARCPRRIADLCETTPPPVREPVPGHRVHCHLEIKDLPIWP